MKERPILFSAPMVRAILEGRKTQTRRIVKWKPRDGANLQASSLQTGHYFTGSPEHGWVLRSLHGGCWNDRTHPVKCPHGGPGDGLIVKEAAWMWCEKRPNGITKTGRPKWYYVPLRSAPVLYCADRPNMPVLDIVSPDTGNVWLWRKKIGRFMPKWASRITIELTAVRVERLNDISEADAIAEGCEPDGNFTAKFDYMQLWGKINGEDSRSKNPFVWVETFKVIERPVTKEKN